MINITLVLFLLFILSQSNLKAQNAADPDTSIGLGMFNGLVRDIKIQADGKILVVGEFTYCKTKNVNYIVRLNVDGSIDNTFNTAGMGANSTITSLAIQADGKILIG
jgi:hypothetical protein